MREKILICATELFLNLGFKSVTMDDIATALGISKKTIYQHFANKTKLVEAATHKLFVTVSCGIDHICALEKNPIEEVYSIKQFVLEHLKDEKSSPQHELKKYYPKIFKDIKSKQFEIMQTCVISNLNRGIKQGLYRDSINVDFIARLYFNSMIVIKDRDLFPLELFSSNMIIHDYLEYYLRGICTPKGLEILKQFITSKPKKQ